MDLPSECPKTRTQVVAVTYKPPAGCPGAARCWYNTFALAAAPSCCGTLTSSRQGFHGEPWDPLLGHAPCSALGMASTSCLTAVSSPQGFPPKIQTPPFSPGSSHQPPSALTALPTRLMFNCPTNAITATSYTIQNSSAVTDLKNKIKKIPPKQGKRVDTAEGEGTLDAPGCTKSTPCTRCCSAATSSSDTAVAKQDPSCPCCPQHVPGTSPAARHPQGPQSPHSSQQLIEKQPWLPPSLLLPLQHRVVARCRFFAIYLFSRCSESVGNL